MRKVFKLYMATNMASRDVTKKNLIGKAQKAQLENLSFHFNRTGDSGSFQSMHLRKTVSQTNGVQNRKKIVR